MALDPANYIDELSITDPTASDDVSEGDDQIRTVKRAVKQSFPSVDIAVNAIHASATEPAVSVAEGLVWIDTSGGAGNHIAKIYDGSAFIVLPFSVETAKTVDIDGGAIDGTPIGAASASTAVVSSLNVNADGATVTGIKDEDDMSSDSAVKLATQQSIKAYVDTQLTAEDLDITTDSGTIDIDLDSETLTVAGGSGLDTSATGTTVTVNVTDEGITNAKLAHMAANTVKVRNANSSGDPSDLALATTEILIGDGTGFTTAALSGDATMTNAGAVSVVKIQGQAVSATAATDDQYLKYSADSSEWQKVDIVGDDKLTTKGDVLTYNTVDSETRMAVGTDDYVLMADAGASNNNGIDWKQIATASIADNAVTLGKLEDGTQGDILYYGASGAPARLGFGTSGYFLKTQGTGADPVWAADTDTTYTAGDGLDLTGTAFSTDLLANGGLEIQSTELSVAQGISQYDVAQFAASVADNDFLKIDGTAVEGRSAAEVLSDISSEDNSWTGSQRATAVTDNDGSYDMDAGQNFITTPSGSTTITFTNITNGQSGFIKLINSGGETISLHSNSKGDANLATTVTAAGTYLLSYFSDGTDVWLTNSAIYA